MLAWPGSPMPYTYRGLPGGTAKRILRRDGHTCYLCGGEATQVDHITNVASGRRTDPSNLAAVCVPCHRLKSEAERIAGVRRRGRRRPPEPHPGVVPPP